MMYTVYIQNMFLMVNMIWTYLDNTMGWQRVAKMFRPNLGFTGCT